MEGSIMIQAGLRQAGLQQHYSADSFRAAGITNFLTNGGSLEVAQRIAGHADSRTTKLYDRSSQTTAHRRHGTDTLLNFALGRAS
jgi:integrase/recombinase XerD